VYVKYYDDGPLGIEALQYAFSEADLLVGFNIKFDLHWLRKVGINFDEKRVWDCQLGEFILENQKNKFPSLEEAAVKYNLGHKIDVIKTEYWDKGINTDAIPRDILTPYAEQDVLLTEQVYLQQLQQFEHNGKYNLFRLHCQDLLVLEEMEWNGILFDVENARKMAEQLQIEQDSLYKQMIETLGNIPFNLNSGDHLSAILYGGTIVIETRIPVGVFKTGNKIGETRYKIVEKKYEMPRLVEPLEKTEVKKPAGSPPVWFTNEDVLRSLKHTKESKKIVALITKYSELEKLRGTYLIGLPKLIEKMGWKEGNLHGQLNQCVAITGRLSSSKPNLQNFSPIAKSFCISRYE
jgi:DNA polymerase I-like protein with 3'-5' exonuclease and polymerase domains